ncbi:MAG: ATP-binding cassette domain-containing protein [Clostridiales bacterium]|nr:ATP-binding cassette domain-containing protein [Clostridiales bacterium]MDR2750701.1 ATP-binding cassette domain-containing protein [Clostridiales bacterium]
MTLELKRITKSYGAKKALSGFSFAAESGSATVLLGRNGAGKTTVLKIATGALAPDSGEILIDGKPLDRNTVKLGNIPDERELAPRLKVSEVLSGMAKLKGIPARRALESAACLLRRMDAEQCLYQKLESLSKGNQKKVMLALALADDPDILTLDEPFVGLDPINQSLLKNMIEERVKAGKTVIFSSQQMPPFEEVCSNICILRNGESVLQGTLSEIKKSYPRDLLRIVPESCAESLALKLRAMPQAAVVRQEGPAVLVRLLSPSCKADVLAAAVDFGIDSFSMGEPSLAQIFMEAAGAM